MSNSNQQMFRRIFRNVLTKCEAVLRAEGRHFNHHLLFYVRTTNVRLGSDEN